uniref:Aminotransferase-like plant mobile domain-containing protein n=1 Tax=Salix viminalis TaxID=40686 RepID=A0A6N2KA70_SALVM
MNKEYVLDGSSSDGELHSFVICLHASELVGLDCKESYLPHRVAMQFGMDQDLPGEPYRSDFTFKNIRFFVPSRTFLAGGSV